MERQPTDTERGIAQRGTILCLLVTEEDAYTRLDIGPESLLTYLQQLDLSISINRLTIQLGLRWTGVRTLLESLEKRDAIGVHPGLRCVLECVCDDIKPVADGGTPADHSDLKSHGLTLAELLDVLSARRRRDAIRVLEGHRAREDTSRDYVTVAELTDGILAGRIDLRDDSDPQTDPDVEVEVDTESRKALYVSLKDNHVPRLDEAGLVDYRPQKRGSTLEPLVALTGIADVLKVLEAIASEPESDR